MQDRPMAETAIVTGAGSGVGRAVVLELARAGWNVALVGRTESSLRRTVEAAGAVNGRLLITPADVSSADQVRDLANRVSSEFGPVDALVNSAGTNVPRRSLAELSMDDYRTIIDVNLTGAYLCVQAVLPQMRRRRRGTIVNVVSDAGLQANAKAGPAYVAAKFALTGLTQSINAEARADGVRACAIFPGDINTPLLDKRPAPPPVDARQRMLQPQDVAACILLAIQLPQRAVIEQLVLRPA
jgi:NAD(P)-dependent dehydrogenase (short-subunit alcohol dehydrogenase family)